ncbi:MAG: hypothetical protein PHN82_00320 [bacterium]|nr:hypothetical protein [bacterium]
MATEQRDVYVISGMGRDVTGLVSLVTSIISGANGNIIDLEEGVFHGLFSIFLTVDLAGANVTGLQFIAEMQAVAHQSGLRIVAERQRFAGRPRPRRMLRILLLGPDHPGIVSGATYLLANNGVNVERAQMISRGDLFAMEMDCDTGSSPCAVDQIEAAVVSEMEKIGIRPFFQAADVYRKKERLVALLPGGNLLEDAAREALSPRPGATLAEAAEVLAGLRVEAVARAVAGLRLSSESEDLLHALRMMGCRTVLMADGLDLLLRPLASCACVDRVVAGRLVTEKGRLTGAVEPLPTDAAARRALLDAVARELGITAGEMICIGGGPPAEILIRDCGVRVLPDLAGIRALASKGALAEAQLPAIARAFGPT